MIVFESIQLASFRNFDDEALHFQKGTNVILGENGHGKSNLLEALYLLCTGKSFRSSHLKELIKLDKQGFCLEAFVFKNDIKHRIYIEFYPHKKKLILDQTTYPHLHPLMGFLPVVIMTPEMKKIIDDGPQERRKFIDFLASQMSRSYFESITRYHKALKQRNATLKLKQDPLAWEKIMAHEWIMIESKRRQIIQDLLTYARSHLLKYPELVADLNLVYKPSRNLQTLDEQNILELFRQTRAQEMHLGTTLIGPHRDDIDIYLNQQLAQTTASEGQKKMLVAALCFASADLIKETVGIDPLFLIDDYDAHFDHLRKEWIQKELSSYSQAFLTSPLADLSTQSSSLMIKHGKVFKTELIHS